MAKIRIHFGPDHRYEYLTERNVEQELELFEHAYKKKNKNMKAFVQVDNRHMINMNNITLIEIEKE